MAAGISQVITQYQTRAEELAQKPLSEWVTRTPWQGLNNLIGAHYAGKTMVVAGRPGSGKSTFMNEMRLNVLRQNKTVVSFVLEMGETHLLERMLASYLGLPIRSVIELEYAKDEVLTARVRAFLSELSVLPWFVYGADYCQWGKFEPTLLQHLSEGVSFVDVDYVQLIEGSRLGENRNQEVAAICQRFAQWAEIYKSHIVYASQLSRGPEQRQDKRPLPGDLRDSGGIEQAADIIITLYRPEMYYPGEYEGDAEVGVVKHRQGPTGIVNMYFDKEKGRFYDISHNDSTGVF